MNYQVFNLQRPPFFSSFFFDMTPLRHSHPHYVKYRAYPNKVPLYITTGWRSRAASLCGGLSSRGTVICEATGTAGFFKTERNGWVSCCLAFDKPYTYFVTAAIVKPFPRRVVTRSLPTDWHSFTPRKWFDTIPVLSCIVSSFTFLVRNLRFQKLTTSTNVKFHTVMYDWGCEYGATFHSQNTFRASSSVAAALCFVGLTHSSFVVYFLGIMHN